MRKSILPPVVPRWNSRAGTGGMIIGLWLYVVGVGAETSWFPIVSFGTSEEILIDMMTIEISGGQTGAWLKYVKENGDYEISYQTFNCTKRSINMIYNVSYSPEGKILEPVQNLFH